MKMIKSIAFVLIVCLFRDAVLQSPPQSPCPGLMRYDWDGSKWTGLVEVANPPPFGSPMKLIVKMSLPARLPTEYVGKIAYAEDETTVLQNINFGYAIKYRIFFPLTSPIPTITNIEFEGRTICSGAEPNSRQITTITLSHITKSMNITLPNNPNGIWNAPNANSNTFNEFGEQPIGNAPDDFNSNPYIPNYNSRRPTIVNAPNDNRNSYNPNYGSERPSNVPNYNQRRPPNSYDNPNNGPGSQQPNFNLHLGPVAPGSNTNNIRPTTETSPAPVYTPTTRTTPAPVYQPTTKFTPQFNSIYSSIVQSKLECGIVGNQFTALIYGGEEIEKGDWPWLVAIHKKNGNPRKGNINFQFMCAGSLISNSLVLTAAHCTGSPRNPFNPRELIVQMGVHSLEDWGDPDVQTKSIGEIIRNPNYGQGGDFWNDIAILKLYSSVAFSKFVRPVCLWEGRAEQSLVYGSSGTVVGWGQDENRAVVTTGPRKIEVPIVSTDECRISEIRFRNGLSSSMLCAGDRDGKIGPCKGDSGGGMFLKQNGKWTIRGVVSYALPSDNSVCDLTHYTVYTDAAQYTQWIQQL